MRNSAIGCAVLLAVIEGVGIGFQRMMAENTRLDVRAPPRFKQSSNRICCSCLLHQLHPQKEIEFRPWHRLADSCISFFVGHSNFNSTQPRSFHPLLWVTARQKHSALDIERGHVIIARLRRRLCLVWR